MASKNLEIIRIVSFGSTSLAKLLLNAELRFILWYFSEVVPLCLIVVNVVPYQVL